MLSYNIKFAMKKAWTACLISMFLFWTLPTQVFALQGSVLGIHILNPSEAQEAQKLLQPDPSTDDFHYLTIPLTLNDLHKQEEWQKFLDFAKKEKLIPIVRLATRVENGAWDQPTKKNIVDEITFLSSLSWPVDEHYVIVFNEVNHAGEWGNQIDPAGYVDALRFTSDWAKSEEKNYQILPAAMDLATPNTGSSREAFAYLDQMYQYDPNIFSYIDFWNSHSYPNPGFSAAATDTGKKSISGFITELNYLKDKTGREYRTFITETGWVDNAATDSSLESYYQYAVDHVWSDPRVVAVTPFVLQGDPGPFSGFTFINRSGQPTHQYIVYQNVIRNLTERK